MSSTWDFSDVFLRIRLGVMGIWVEDHGEKVPFSLYRIVVRTVNVISHGWNWPSLHGRDFCVRFLSWRVTHFPSFHTVPFGRKLVWGAHPQGAGVLLSRLEGGVLASTIWGFSLWENYLFFIYFFQYRLLDMYFITWVLIQGCFI